CSAQAMLDSKKLDSQQWRLPDVHHRATATVTSASGTPVTYLGELERADVRSTSCPASLVTAPLFKSDSMTSASNSAISAVSSTGASRSSLVESGTSLTNMRMIAAMTARGTIQRNSGMRASL